MTWRHLAKGHSAPITPLVEIAPDGWTTYQCLECGRPVAPALPGKVWQGRWRHYKYARWMPRRVA